MNPKIWGPHAWFFLHSITLGYPDNPSTSEKNNIKNFFLSVGNVLPCPLCRSNYVKHLVKYPLDEYALSSKKSLVQWLINIHNAVNRLYGRKELSYDDVMDKYYKDYDDGTEYNIIITVIICAFILLLLVYIIKKSIFD